MAPNGLSSKRIRGIGSPSGVRGRFRLDKLILSIPERLGLRSDFRRKAGIDGVDWLAERANILASV
jgi:hypothetical protein